MKLTKQFTTKKSFSEYLAAMKVKFEDVMVEEDNDNNNDDVQSRIGEKRTREKSYFDENKSMAK